jgi:hypothetical protein
MGFFVRVLGLLLTCSLCQLFASAEVREFSSKDGAKSLQAEIVDVDPARGTIRLKTVDGRIIDAPLSAFSADASEHAREFLDLQEVGRRLGLRFEEVTGNIKEEKIPSKGQAILTTPTGYLLTARNNGAAEMQDIELHYQVFYSEDQVTGGRVGRLAAGSLSIDSLQPREEQELFTSQVDIVRMKKLPASECDSGR